MVHATPTGRVVLVFNGEIYNYRELRAELIAQGETFTSESDTEVLLRLLLLEGPRVLPRLAGMFAFAFWREDTGTALLARDALGIKPLYYRLCPDGLTFASETRVLRPSGAEGAVPDPVAVRDFLLWGSVPEPATLQGEVRQLPAGHWLEWRADQVTQESWFQPRLGELLPPVDSVRTTREALRESIRRHLVSDVPVGIFLSGGIDSTAVLALTREALGPDADLRTFSIGFADPEFDESALARRTASHFGTQHTEWRMTAAEGAEEIAGFLAAMDQPTLDGFNTWCVSKLARRAGVKVVLSGLGGDELFAGYNSFERVPTFHRWHRRLGWLRGGLALGLEQCPPGSRFRRLASFCRSEGRWLAAYHAQRGIFTEEEAGQLTEALTGHRPAAPDWELAGLPADPRDVVSHLELTRYMRNQLLRDSDVFSMAHGLELRVPFVDSRLVDTLATIPARSRLQPGKQLLLDAVPEIPAWIRSQPKRGFRFPFQTWMEGSFAQRLEAAAQQSPVPLVTWYRRWALAALLHTLRPVPSA
jgi:asparagine synthase (glutamine-hydrolysing)